MFCYIQVFAAASYIPPFPLRDNTHFRALPASGNPHRCLLCKTTLYSRSRMPIATLAIIY